ncbi:hypothetical protein [Trinickia diaoshuihuensis]|uniref:hypothetical protein n=1 Tax=Trinickia diaoshuihuensis TaxID=2292265 RepID=UPI0013C2EF90|nr:hypothetical protein [Trinickia diaoshuihuensis]
MNFGIQTAAIGHLQQAVDIMGDNWSAFRRTIILQNNLAIRENILLGFLKAQPAVLADIAFVNTELIDNRTSIPLNTGSLHQLKTAWPMVQIHRPHLRKFYASRGDTRLRDLVKLIAPVAHGPYVASTVDILNAIGVSVNAITSGNIGYRGNFDGIARGEDGITIGAICRLLRLHPPGSVFPGFAAWGDGDHSSPAMNTRFHFMKHVLFISSDPGLTSFTAKLLTAAALNENTTVEATRDAFDVLTEDEEGPATADECADWWRTLKIVLPRQVCETLIDQTDPDKSKVLRLWCPDTELLHAYVAEFVRSRVIERNPRLLAWFFEHYQDAYRDYAITRSRTLKDIVVSSNGAKVFVAGTNGKDFIIGRLDNTTGNLGISSCYKPAVPAEKMSGQHSQKLWALA